MFKERIEYDNIKTLEEAMRKENFRYGQNKTKRDNIPNQKNKRRKSFEQKNKVTQFYKNIGKKEEYSYKGVAFFKKCLYLSNMYRLQYKKGQ